VLLIAQGWSQLSALGQQRKNDILDGAASDLRENYYDTIQAATSNAADLLGHSHEFGSIRPGKYADIVAVTGDPLTDIRLLKNVQFVMKEGKVDKQ
jgi:imidazolonepropionase-like amidohydrolase